MLTGHILYDSASSMHLVNIPLLDNTLANLDSLRKV